LFNEFIWFVRGQYYWWFDAYDAYNNLAQSNVSRLSLNMTFINIVSPVNNSRNFSKDGLVQIVFNSTQVLDSCKFNINGGGNISIPPINFYVGGLNQGQNYLQLICRNVNGTGWTSVNFSYYNYPSLALVIHNPKNGQFYRDPSQKVSISYNTSFTVPYLNLSLNGAPYVNFVNGQLVAFPVGNNILKVTIRASPPYAFPYDSFDSTGIEEFAEVRFTTGDKIVGAMTDLMIYFWAFMLFVVCGMFFAFLRGSEDPWQYFMRTVWYSMEMLIGFGVIVESIKFIRTIIGTGGG
jgi:hypothetical protein